MIALLSAFSSIPSTLATTVVKVTIVLATAGIAALILHRTSAAVRHLVWLLALGSCVVLAVAAPAVPRIDVPVRATGISRAGDVSPITARIVRTDRSRPIVIATPTAVGFGGERENIIVPVVAPEMGAAVSLRNRLPLPFLIALVWVVGFVSVVGRSRLGHSRVASIVDDARRLTSADWLSALRDASIDVGIRRDVEILESDEITSPMTSGFFNPVIVVPMEAREWDAERRHIVLVHELAHVARFDYVAQIVATAACAIFWFHPFVWLATARLRAEAEHAADDHVLNAGTGGVTYATHLLDLAREHSGDFDTAVAVGMVRSSRLEGRFRAMLDATRSRASISPRLRAIATSLTLCAMIPVAGLRPAEPRHTFDPVIRVAPQITEAVAIELPEPTAVAITQTRGLRAETIALASTTAADSTFEKTITASSGDKLTLELRSGGAISIHGWDEPRIRVVGRLGGRDWRDTRVSLDRVSGGVRLRSDMESSSESWSTAHEFELWVPKHTNVQLSSAGGSLAINDLSGDFYGHTGGGGITIEGATGSAALSTGGGEVAVTNSRLSGNVTTGGGELTISNVTGGLRGSSGSGGNIVSNGSGLSTVRGGFGSGGSRSISTASGDAVAISKDGGEIVVDRAPDGAILHTGGGRIVVGSSGRGVSANTGGGDIELEHVAGDATATTGSGDVRISIDNSARSDHFIDVESGRGRIVIEVPASLDARIELETAYTDNFNRKTSITSDFALTNSETDRWDSSHGTPRKYIRATGMVGSGRGLIRIHTVNGDVVLKRVTD